MKRFLCGLLALCLLGCLPVSAAGPTLRYQQTGEGVRLTLEGLEEEVYALQLELVLEGEVSKAKFTPAQRDVYCPDCHLETGRSETGVTVYLVAEGEPLSGKSLFLGTLDLEGRPQMPSKAELVLLDRNLKPLTDGRVSLSAGSGSGADGLYPVHILPSEHGTVTVRPTGAKEGETVTLSVTPDAGYTLSAITARDARNRTVSLNRDGLNRYTFPMPAMDVEVSASFTQGGGLAFSDVAPGDWCYDAVRYVFEAGLMNGTSTTTFTPNASTTRGMIVAILYRLEGSPVSAYTGSDSSFFMVNGEPAGMSAFTDVAPTAYYANAVAWASANGIVNGYSDGTFHPNQLITREQMAAFLYRYASYKGRNVSEEADLSAFADAGQIASYAVTPLRWAAAAGLINGVSANRLAPAGTATRAQAAVILSRFVQNVL